MTTPTRLTRKRLQALIDLAERGLEEQAYGVREETGVDLDETEETLVEQVKRIGADDLGFYTAYDLREMYDQRRAALSAIEIIARRLHPERYETAPQVGAEQEQDS